MFTRRGSLEWVLPFDIDMCCIYIKFMEDDKSSTVLCPSCLKENPANTVYCSNCNSPFGINASTDPVQMAISEGRSLGDGVLKPRKAIILFGMWAVIFPCFGFFLFLSLAVFINGDEISIGSLVVSLVSLVISLFFGFILVKTTRNFFRLRKEFKSANLSDSEEE